MKDMEKHLGDILVRFEEPTHYIVKVRITDYEGRTEANLKVPKDKAKTLGITSFSLAKKILPLSRNFILQEINQQYPEFWVIDS